MLNGVPNPDNPGRWIVPPWAPDATFHQRAAHFLRFHPWGNENTRHLLAYYRGYLTAIDAAAPPDPNASPSHIRWRKDLRRSIDRCVIVYEEKQLKSV